MLALADELLARSIDFFFIIKSDDFWVKRIGEKHKVIFLTDSKNQLDDLCENLIQNQVTHLVYDTRNDLRREDLEHISRTCKIKIIVNDSPEDTRIAADCVLFPPIIQVREWSWKGFKGKIFSDWDYVLLRKEFIDRKSLYSPKPKNKILFSFGSTDPYFLTEQTIKSIVKSGDWYEAFEFLLIAGPQFDRLDSIKKLEEYKLLNIKIFQAPENIAEIYASVDFAFIAFGVTAYELAALGVPFLYVSISEDHEKSAKMFELKGIGVNFGLVDSYTNDFKNKMKLFLNRSGSILKHYKKGDLGSTICNWDEIIKVIIE